jgi:hypothetical protein
MIFGIGLSRTGTTSLHHAFELLGLRSAPSSVALLDGLDQLEGPDLRDYEAFTDNPVPFLYRELDELHPGSKFVLTTRALEPWLESMRWLFGEGVGRLDRPTRRLAKRVHRDLYGLRRFDAAVLTQVYESHHRGVAEWFADRPHDLLRIDLTAPSSTDPGRPLPWHPLCDFLGLPVPDSPFPRSNGRNDPPPPRSLTR